MQILDGILSPVSVKMTSIICFYQNKTVEYITSAWTHVFFFNEKSKNVMRWVMYILCNITGKSF
jgi:hypothetical protein